MAFQNLGEVDPATAHHLIEQYGRVWLREAGPSQDHLPEVGDTVALVVAGEWEDSGTSGTKRLRLTSRYTSSAYYLPDWDGELKTATAWIRRIAQLQAANLRVERVRYGPTPWDRT